MDRDACGVEGRTQHGQLLMGAGEYGDLAGAQQRRRLAGDEAGDECGLGALVVGAADLDGRPVVARRHGVGGLGGHRQHVPCGGDDLRCAAPVGGQADDLDAG